MVGMDRDVRRDVHVLEVCVIPWMVCAAVHLAGQAPDVMIEHVTGKTKKNLEMPLNGKKVSALSQKKKNQLSFSQTLNNLIDEIQIDI